MGSTREENRAYYLKRRALVRALKNVPCAECGGTFPPYVMDFHHRDPAEKEFNIGTNVMKNLDSLLAEIAKCDVVCANCHRVLEYTDSE
jgi:hypothetical protein